ncbi:hypothetical protein [Arthrobacter sp.]|uniref:hypothetical protein n=1 Tax=Arthrobacter sp. TaxID=1667 RepID=UPI003A8C8E13
MDRIAVLGQQFLDLAVGLDDVGVPWEGLTLEKAMTARRRVSPLASKASVVLANVGSSFEEVIASMAASCSAMPPAPRRRSPAPSACQSGHLERQLAGGEQGLVMKAVFTPGAGATHNIKA